MIEIEQDNKVKSTWAKVLSQSDGNKDKAESLYISMRFEEIKNEILKKQQKEKENSFGMSEKMYLNDSNKKKDSNSEINDDLLGIFIKIIVFILFVFVCIQFS
jgi:hypothetical protein